MTTPGIGQPFPSIPAPFVRVIDDKTGLVIAHGQIEQIWLQLLIALWNRTGGAAGINSAAALIEAFLAESETESKDHNGGGLSGLLNTDSSPSSRAEALQAFVSETVRVEVERLGLLGSDEGISQALLTFLLASDDNSSDDSSDDDSTSWVPLVTGAEPPVLVSDGAGHLIFVAWSP